MGCGVWGAHAFGARGLLQLDYLPRVGWAECGWEASAGGGGGGNRRAAKGRTETLGLRRARLVAATESKERLNTYHLIRTGWVHCGG